MSSDCESCSCLAVLVDDFSLGPNAQEELGCGRSNMRPPHALLIRQNFKSASHNEKTRSGSVSAARSEDSSLTGGEKSDSAGSSPIPSGERSWLLEDGDGEVTGKRDQNREQELDWRETQLGGGKSWRLATSQANPSDQTNWGEGKSLESRKKELSWDEADQSPKLYYNENELKRMIQTGAGSQPGAHTALNMDVCFSTTGGEAEVHGEEEKFKDTMNRQKKALRNPDAIQNGTSISVAMEHSDLGHATQSSYQSAAQSSTVFCEQAPVLSERLPHGNKVVVDESNEWQSTSLLSWRCEGESVPLEQERKSIPETTRSKERRKESSAARLESFPATSARGDTALPRSNLSDLQQMESVSVSLRETESAMQQDFTGQADGQHAVPGNDTWSVQRLVLPDNTSQDAASRQQSVSGSESVSADKEKIAKLFKEKSDVKAPIPFGEKSFRRGQRVMSEKTMGEALKRSNAMDTGDLSYFSDPEDRASLSASEAISSDGDDEIEKMLSTKSKSRSMDQVGRGRKRDRGVKAAKVKCSCGWMCVSFGSLFGFHFSST